MRIRRTEALLRWAAKVAMAALAWGRPAARSLLGRLGRPGLKTRARFTEGDMAETINDAGHPDMDYAEHEATYGLFLTLMKYITIVAIVIVVFLAWMWG